TGTASACTGGSWSLRPGLDVCAAFPPGKPPEVTALRLAASRSNFQLPAQPVAARASGIEHVVRAHDAQRNRAASYSRGEAVSEGAAHIKRQQTLIGDLDRGTHDPTQAR